MSIVLASGGTRPRPAVFMRPVGGGTSGGSLRSSRQAVACHPFTRSWATMPPSAPPPTWLSRNYDIMCFYERYYLNIANIEITIETRARRIDMRPSFMEMRVA